MAVARNMALFLVAFVLCVAGVARAEVYYVDYDGGADDRAGTSPAAAFKHCPGDQAATGKAKATEFQLGDKVIFKGGVHYYGTVTAGRSGQPGKPIVYDGNTEGAFGEGKAIIDGGTPITKWTRCSSAQEAGGNPQWSRIYHATLPKPLGWNRLNLCDGRKSLPIAQDPNPEDPIFQENPGDYHHVEGQLALDCPVKIYPEKGTHADSNRPLIVAVTESRGSGVVSPVVGAAFSVELPGPVTVTALGIGMQPDYTAVKDVVFSGDGKVLLKASLDKDHKETQKFSLAEPATFRKLTVKFLSTHEAVKQDWTAIRQVAAWDAKGNNLLRFPARMTLADEKVFTQGDPRYYEGMVFGVHGGPNIIIYLGVQQYVPAENRIYLDYYAGRQYEKTRYCLLNSVRLIDLPGEYSVQETEDPKQCKVYLMPEKVAGGAPAGMSYSARGEGVLLRGASHVVVQGFRIQRQGNRSQTAGISARGPARDVVIRDCEVTMVRLGVGITTYQVNDVIVDGCHVHHNPGHSKGIVLRNARNLTTRNCALVKNTSTALVYYDCEDGVAADNLVTDHRGMHANGLTFYLGCKNTIVERNRVSRGNIALTFQTAENITIRNNIFDGNGKTMVVGIWGGQPLKNVRFLNNCMVRSNHDVTWQTGLFSNNRKIEGLVVRNNIIDGLCGTPAFSDDVVFSHNLYTRMAPYQKDRKLGLGEIVEEDLKKIFVDPDSGDFRLKAGSPAIDAGTNVGLKRDFAGNAVSQGKAPDIGPYEYAAGQGGRR